MQRVTVSALSSNLQSGDFATTIPTIFSTSNPATGGCRWSVAAGGDVSGLPYGVDLYPSSADGLPAFDGKFEPGSRTGTSCPDWPRGVHESFGFGLGNRFLGGVAANFEQGFHTLTFR